MALTSFELDTNNNQVVLNFNSSTTLTAADLSNFILQNANSAPTLIVPLTGSTIATPSPATIYTINLGARQVVAIKDIPLANSLSGSLGTFITASNFGVTTPELVSVFYADLISLVLLNAVYYENGVVQLAFNKPAVTVDLTKFRLSGTNSGTPNVSLSGSEYSTVGNTLYISMTEEAVAAVAAAGFGTGVNDTYIDADEGAVIDWFDNPLIPVSGLQVSAYEPAQGYSLSGSLLVDSAGGLQTASGAGLGTANVNNAINIVDDIVDISVNAITLPSNGYWTSMAYREDTNTFIAVDSSAKLTVVSTGGSTWGSGGNTPDPYYNFNKVLYVGSDRWIAVGKRGSNNAAVGNFATSTDNGTTWSNLGTGGYSALWAHIATNGTRVVVIAGIATYNAGGSSSRVGTVSEDNGATFTGNGSYMPTSRLWSGLAYGNGIWVAIVGGESRVVATSPTGLSGSWTEYTTAMPSSEYWHSVTYGNGIFMAIAGSSSQSNKTAGAISSDGVTWTAITLPSERWVNLSYYNGTWVAIATGGTRIAAYSTDNGTNWTQVTLNATVRDWSAVAGGTAGFPIATYGSFAGGSLLATTSLIQVSLGSVDDLRITGGANGYFLKTDGAGGLSWDNPASGLVVQSLSTDTTSNVVSVTDAVKLSQIRNTTPPSTPNYWWNAVYTGSRFIAVDGGIYGNTNQLADGGSYGDFWGSITVPSTQLWYGIASDNTGNVVVTSLGSNTFLRSDNYGSSWSTVTLTNPNPLNWGSVAHGNGIFVALEGGAGYNGNTYAYSTNGGATWTEGSTGLTRIQRGSLVYGNGIFLCTPLGSAETIRSANGASWTVGSLPNSGYYYCLAYGAGLFVTVAQNSNTVYTSPDGINWTARSGLTVSGWRSITFVAGIFIIASTNSTNLGYSVDGGLTWGILSNQIPSGSWTALASGNPSGANVLVAISSAAFFTARVGTAPAATFLNTATVNLGNAANIQISGANPGQFLSSNNGALSWSNIPPTPAGGSNTQIQYNDGNNFNGVPGFTYNKTSDVLAIGDISRININGNTAPGIPLVSDGQGGLLFGESNSVGSANVINTQGGGEIGSYVYETLVSNGVNWTSITYAENIERFVAVSNDSSGGNYYVSNRLDSNLLQGGSVGEVFSGSNGYAGLSSVQYGNNIIVAMAVSTDNPNDARSYTSTNGNTWSTGYNMQQALGGYSGKLSYGNGKFLAPYIVGNGQFGFYSTDGQTWNSDNRLSYDSDEVTGNPGVDQMAHGGGFFAGLTTGTNPQGLLISTDDLSNLFAYLPLNAGGTTNKIVYQTESNTFAVISQDSRTVSVISNIAYDAGGGNGIPPSVTANIVTNQNAIPTNAGIADAAYGSYNGLGVIYTASPNINGYFVTAENDSSEWGFTYPAEPPSSTARWSAVAYGENQEIAKFLVISNGSRYLSTTTYYPPAETTIGATSNGTVTIGTGIQVTNGSFSANVGNLPANASWSVVAYANGNFVALDGGSSNLGARSTDGSMWNYANTPFSRPFIDLIATGRDGNYTGNLLAIPSGELKTTYRTADGGENWDTTATLPLGPDWGRAASSPTRVVVIPASGGNRTVVYSVDEGTNWNNTNNALPISTSWGGLAYGNGTFVAVSDASSAVAATSTDGETWTQRYLPVAGRWSSITYGGNAFVAVANNTNYSARSLDNGVTWEVGRLPLLENWSSVTWNNGVFLAVSGNNTTTAATSIDGLYWTRQQMPERTSWSSVIGGPSGEFVAVSSTAANSRSGTGRISAVINVSATQTALNGDVYLGPVENITITGGNAGQFLQTDGAGNLTWAAAGGGGGGNSISNGNTDVSIGTANGSITGNVADTQVLSLTENSVAVGTNAGANTQSARAVAVGFNAGQNTQGTDSVAVGRQAGQTTQGQNAVAVGIQAGNNTQGTDSVAVGRQAGQTTQGGAAVAVGPGAGAISQAANSVAVGQNAGSANTTANSTYIGANAGRDGGGFANVIVLNSTGANFNPTVGNATFISSLRANVSTGNAVYYNNATGELSYAPAASGSSNSISNGNSDVTIGTANGNITGNVVNARVLNLTADGVAIGNGAGSSNQSANAVAIGKLAGSTTQGQYAVAIGWEAAINAQGVGAVAIGQSVAANSSTSQGQYAVAIGGGAGYTAQANYSVAVGTGAGFANTTANSVYIGANAGRNGGGFANVIVLNATGNELNPTTGNATFISSVRNDTANVTNAVYWNTTTKELTYGPGGGGSNSISNGNTDVSIGTANGSITGNLWPGYDGIVQALLIDRTTGPSGGGRVALGFGAGATNQGGVSIAIGSGAGLTNQGSFSVAIGACSAVSTQSANSVAVGAFAGTTTQGENSVAVGRSAGQSSQGENSVAVGRGAGNDTQGIFSVAVGDAAGETAQGEFTVAIGSYAGSNAQGGDAVAVGYYAAQDSQGANAVAIGSVAASSSQGAGAVAIGSSAAQTSQGDGAVAIGASAGVSTQGANSVAIGHNAGNENTSPNSIYIGANAGINAGNFANVIVLNATGANLNPTVGNATFISSVRSDTANVINAVYWNSSTKELTYGNAANISLQQFSETVVNGGTVSGTITPNAASGTIYTYTLSGGITLNTIANARAGTSMTFILTQGTGGSKTLTSSWLFANGEKTLSTAAGAVDVLSVFYTGTTYYATLSKGYA